MTEPFTIKGELYILSSYGDKYSDGSRQATLRLASDADDPVSDLAKQSHADTTDVHQSAQKYIDNQTPDLRDFL